MTWHWPNAFWFLIIPVALAVWELTRRVRAGAQPLPKVLRAEALPGRLALSGSEAQRPSRPRFRWRMWLGLMLAIVALARPQWGEIEEQVFDQAREILIAVDLSRSMLAPDVPPSRLERARLLITSLLEQLEGERVGLLVFAGTAFLQSPLSADYEILREFLPALEPDFLPQGGTDYAAMLETALDAFGKEDGSDRFLIVLSDGESQTDKWEALVEKLDERGIKVIGLGIGTPDGAMLPDGEGGFVKDERGAVVLSRLNPSTLEELARRTGGVYRDASTWVDLAAVVEDTVAAGRQGEFAEVNRVRRIERFQWALAPALLLLLLSYWREFPVHPRSRNVPLQATGTPPRPAATTAATALALLAALAIGAPRLPAQQQQQQPENAFAAPLRETVARLSGEPTLAAKDFADLAKTTVTYGERMMNAQQRPEPGVVDDALAAVDAGEALDSQAADWETLRRQLEALRPPEQQQQQQEQPEQQPQENQKSDDSQDSEQSQQQQQKQQEQSDSEQKQEPQDSEQSESPENAPQDDQQQSQPQDQSQPSNAPSQSAFGDMTPPSEENGQPEEPPTPPQNTQQVGGQSERSFDEKQDPALAIPLQKLNELRRQDSPAELYQLMQDPNARPTEKGRDW